MSRKPYTRLTTRVPGFIHRACVLILLISFVLTPLSPAFAQEAPAIDSAPAVDSAPSTPTPSDSETPTTPETPATPDTTAPVSDTPTTDIPVGTTDDQTAPAPETSADVVVEPTIELPTDDATTPEDALATDKADIDAKAEELDATAKDQQMMAMSSSDPQAPSVAMPSFTYQSIAPKVDKANGALTQSIKLAVPPGRNGMNPDLALTYNSQNLDESIVGYGWSVNIPYIERINRYGTNELYNHSKTVFASSISGELASTTTYNEYRAKVDEGDFLKYTFSTSTATGGTWTVYDKQGTKYTFGTNAQARQDNSGDTSQVTRWMLEEVRDTNNNFIRYEYYKDANQIYPSKIYYTGSGATDGIFTVEFARETRPDIITSYRTRFLVTTNYRITEISAKMNGTLVRKYTLAYTSGNNTKRSLLASITEMGQNESGSGTLTLPPVTFEYTNDTPAFATTTILNQHSIPNVTDAGWAVADANGDGVLDVVRSSRDSGVTTNGITLNNGINDINAITGSFFAPYWGAGSPYTAAETGSRIIDLNGDGLPDALRSHFSGIGGVPTSTSEIYFNNSVGTSLSWTVSTTSVTVPIFAYEYSNGADVTLGLFGNLNGDGLIDFERASAVDNPTANNGPYFGNGSALVKGASTDYVPKVFLPGYGEVDAINSQLIDINGDGLDDWFRNEGLGVAKFYLNNGTGWNATADVRWQLATNTVQQAHAYDRGIRFTDINGDGLLDYVRSYLVPTYTRCVDPYCGGVEVGDVREVMLNTGFGWASSTIQLPNQSRIVTGSVYAGHLNTLDRSEMWDWTGDGVTDMYYNGSSMFKNTAHKQDMLKKITYATGGNTEVEYTPTPQQLVLTQDVYGNHWWPKHVNLPYMLYTVTKLTTNDGKGNQDVATYTYENGDFYYNGPYDRKIAGFESIAEDRGGTLTKTYYYQGNTASTTLGEFNDHVSKIGKAYREDVSASSNGTLYKRTFYTWDNYDQGGGRNIIALTKTLEQTFDGDSDHKDKAANYTYDTANGNLIQKIDWGEVTGNSDGTFTDTGSDRASTTISYVASSSVNMWLPKQETTVDQSLTKVKETRHYYDTLALGSVTKGNETKRESWVSGSSYIDTEKTFNTYGLVTQEKDPRDKATNYTYDTYNLYPASVTNPLSHVTSYTYDYSSGKPLTVTNPNTRVFQYIYDPVDRLIEEKQPDQTTPSTLVTKTTYAYTDTPNSKSILKTNYLDGSTSALEYTYFDGLDRVIQTRTEVEDANTFSVTDRVYDNRGLLWKESLPYFSTGSANTTPTGTSALYTTYTYDVMQRPTVIARVVGNETRAYDDWKTTITDPRGNPKSLYSDARGNLKQVDEVNSGQTYTTVYDWNLLNSLTRITDAENNVRNFTYDGLGRRLTAQDLHAQADGTYGTWTYAYDATGNIATTTDPKSQVVVRTYDDLNRPLTENYTGGTGTEATFTYDTCTDGKGRICRAVFTGSATSTYLYTPLGQLKAEGKLIAGTSTVATTTYEYNRQGNTTKITTPDNAQVTYAYNSAGLLETVQRKEAADGSYTNVVTDFDYAPTGAITYTAYANGVISTNTYDADNLYRLKQKKTCKGVCISALDDVQVLVVGGGGGGGGVNHGGGSWSTFGAGGGGAGGMKEQILSIGVGVYPITVGAGGAGGIGATVQDGADGTGSSIGSILSVSGGGGGGFSNKSSQSRVGHAGGSGGGGGVSEQVLAGGVGIVGQGNNGGNGSSIYYGTSGGGGGGKGGAGGTPTAGAGQASIISGSSVTYATGGAGGVGYAGNGNGANGAANTGTGGGGARWENYTGYADGGNGGSGIVIIRYPTSIASHFTCGGTTSVSGSDTVCKFTSSTTTQNFTVSTTTNPESTYIQNLTYTYDANGNITRLVDAAQTSASKTVDYTYDALNRLSTAISTGAANGQDYRHTYAYSPVGNITSVGRGSSTSTYAYAQTNYTNPHAATSIGISSGGGGGGTSTTTTHTLYAEALGSGWEDWSWSTTINPSNTSPVRTGTYSLSSNHTAAWGGMYLHHAGVSTSGSTHLTFAVRVPTAGTYIELESYGSGDTLLGTVVLNDYIPGGSMAANTWYDVSIPLSALGASNTTFTGLVAMRSTTGYVYWDDLKFVNVSAGGGGGSSATTTLAYDNAGNLTSMGTSTYAWNYRNMLTQSGNGVATSTYVYDTDGARRKLTEAGVTTYFPSKYYEVTGTSTTKHIFAGDLLLATVQNGGSSGGTSTTTTATIYDDATTWNDWSWDTTVNLNETTTVYSGTKSLKATYTAAWGGLYLQNSSGPSTAGATHLHFAVRSSTADPDVEIDAYGPGDNLLGYVTLDTYIPSMSANTWYVVDIPLSAIGATNSTLTGFSALRGTTGVLYFDEIKLVAAGQGGGGGTGTTVRYVHTDHLNSTNVVTSSTGAIVQTLDYYPYGGSRVNDSVGGADEKRKYIGQYTDAVSSLSYLNARYYDSARGQFTSQDPVFLEIGGPLRGEKLQTFLANPQTLNSYGYAENNPIIKMDPEGRCAGPLMFVCLGVIGANLGIWTNYAGGVLSKPQDDPNRYQFDMSYREVGTSAGLGAFELAALPENRLYSGLYAFNSSLAEDKTAGNQANYRKAIISAGTSVIAGTFFKNLVGNVPASLATRAQITNQVFQNASVLVANNAAGANNSIPFQTAQSAAKAAGIGNTGSGTFVGTYNFGPGIGTFNFGTGSWTGNAQSTPATIK